MVLYSEAVTLWTAALIIVISATASLITVIFQISVLKKGHSIAVSSINAAVPAVNLQAC